MPAINSGMAEPDETGGLKSMKAKIAMAVMAILTFVLSSGAYLTWK